MCWDSEARTFKGTLGKTTRCCFSLCFCCFFFGKKKISTKQVSFFLMGQPAATGNCFQSIYSRLFRAAGVTWTPMNFVCRLPFACVAVVGLSLSSLPMRFPQWAQTITWSLYPPNTEQIRRLYSPDCRGHRSQGVFLKLQLSDARRRK